MTQQIRKKAQQRVNHKKGVYIHFTASLACAIILATVALIVGDPIEFWVLFPILPLSLAFFIHYVVIFGFPWTNVMTEEWEERELAYEMWKLHQHKQGQPFPLPEAIEEELELKELRQKMKNIRDEDFV